MLCCKTISTISKAHGSISILDTISTPVFRKESRKRSQQNKTSRVRRSHNTSYGEECFGNNRRKSIKHSVSNVSTPYSQTSVISKKINRKKSKSKMIGLQSKVLSLTNQNIKLKNRVVFLEKQLKTKSKKRVKDRNYDFNEYTNYEDKENCSVTNISRAGSPKHKKNQKTHISISRGRSKSHYKTFDHEYKNQEYKEQKITKKAKIFKKIKESKDIFDPYELSQNSQQLEEKKQYDKQLKSIEREIQILRLEDDLNPVQKKELKWKNTYKKMINDLGELHSDVDRLQFDSTDNHEIKDYLKNLKM
mmetsp:Transcript_13755/g.12189  ORF Transcript_13755/g.12189 Transcript_13755/m.12189 type:complete len:305 (+) Transcript_13755:94-1008(+)